MKNVLFCIICLMIVSGCVKEKIDLRKVNSDSFDPSFAIPIGNVKMQLDRLNDQSNRFLRVNSTSGILEFVYQNGNVDLKFSDFYNIPSQSVSAITSMDASQVAAFNLVPTGLTYSYSSSDTSLFTVASSEELDSMIIKNGSLNLAVSSTYSHDISIVVTIPSLIKNGVIFSDTIPLNYTSSVPVTNMVNLSLSGYTVDLTDGGTAFNTLRFNFNTTITKGATPATTAEAITFTSGFTLSEIESAHGYFGNRTITETDTVEYDLFGNVFGGSVSLADPRIELDLYNSTGISF